METTLPALQALAPPIWVRGVLVLVMLGLVTSDAVLGVRDQRTLVRDLAADPGNAVQIRTRFLYRWIRMGWTAALAALLVVAVLPGVGTGDLGLRMPDLSSLMSGEDRVAGVLVGITAGVLVALVAGTVAARVALKRTGRLPLPEGTPVAAMLPTAKRDGRAWAGLALTAGITEEVTYRGLVLLALAVVLPAAPALLLVVLASVLFGMAHAYQGTAGVVVTGLMGAVFVLIYLATGSLLPGMVLHVLIDLRPLALLPPPAPSS